MLHLNLCNSNIQGPSSSSTTTTTTLLSPLSPLSPKSCSRRPRRASRNPSIVITEPQDEDTNASSSAISPHPNWNSSFAGSSPSFPTPAIRVTARDTKAGDSLVAASSPSPSVSPTTLDHRGIDAVGVATGKEDNSQSTGTDNPQFTAGGIARKRRPKPPTLNTNPFRVRFDPACDEKAAKDDRRNSSYQRGYTRRQHKPPASAVERFMACLPSITGGITSYEEPISPTNTRNGGAGGSSTSNSLHAPSKNDLRSRRRHSYHSSVLPIDVESINVGKLLDNFLNSFNRRLDFLDAFFSRQSQNLAIEFDAGISQAWSTLHAVRESCNHVSDEMLDAGRRRGSVLVETLESNYKEALARKETMEAKLQESIKMLDGILTDFETRAYRRMRESRRLSDAYDLLDSGRRLSSMGLARARHSIDEGLEKARKAKEALQAQVAAAIQLARTHGLLSYDDMPEPWRVNPHILKGYRFNETPLDALRSIASLSNEMFNIWSHLLGLVLMLVIAFYIYPSTAAFSSSSQADILVAGLFFAAAVKCLACSTLWHTMSHISCQKTMERFACVDYTGISFLIGSSIITTEYTAFYCEPISRWTWISTTAVLGVCGTIGPWHPTFNRHDLSWLRVLFYCSLAMTGFLPVIQLVLTRGVSDTIYFYAPITKSMLVYFCGAILYAAKIPERWYPGAFDFVGGSHNIWHIAVLGGILFHYSAMQHFFKSAFERVGSNGGVCSVY